MIMCIGEPRKAEPAVQGKPGAGEDGHDDARKPGL